MSLHLVFGPCRSQHVRATPPQLAHPTLYTTLAGAVDDDAIEASEAAPLHTRTLISAAPPLNTHIHTPHHPSPAGAVDDDAIKAAFKKAALQLHPDRHAGSGDAEAVKKAAGRFQRLQVGVCAGLTLLLAAGEHVARRRPPPGACEPHPSPTPKTRTQRRKPP